MLFYFLLAGTLGCEYITKFTVCEDNALAAFVTPSECVDESPFLVTNLPCDHFCPPGWKLDLDVTTHALICTQCLEGTYSIGGGTQFTSWGMNSEDFQTYCWVMTATGWEMSLDCTSWHASSESILVSGDSSPDYWYATELVFYSNIVHQGSLIISYRKDTSSFLGWDIGDFYVFIDQNLAYFDYSFDSAEWKTLNVSMPIGIHRISIMFDKYTTDQVSEVQIKEIQIRGTDFSAKECKVCSQGSSHKGSDKCMVCEANTYLSQGSCIRCPYGTVSQPGSTSERDCYDANLCSLNDYHFYYSDCEGGKMKKVYEWNTPLMCDNSGIDLPLNEDLDCRPCSKGEYYEGSKCKSCPTGTYITDGHLGNTCQECSQGKYAPKVSEYAYWTKIPEVFQSFCVSTENAVCSYGWEARGTYLITSPVYETGSKIYLQTRVNVTENNAQVDFQFAIHGEFTKFTLYIDGIVRVSYIGAKEERVSLPLELGEHSLKWVCVHSWKGEEECKILSILIEGGNTGGAYQCVSCKQGFYSLGSTDYCIKCPAGTTSNSDKTGCDPCKDTEISTSDGLCQNCPNGLNPSENHTHCIVNESLNLNTTVFILKNFSGSEGQQPEYCDLSRLKMFCYETFYGPSEYSGNYFYISILNPSEVLMPSYTQVSQGKAYAFGIMDKDKLSLPIFNLTKPNDTCTVEQSKIVVNLGSQVESVEAKSNGFDVSYINGDICSSTERFSTNIMFFCDKDEIEGWPIFAGNKSCKYNFYWPTIHACHICRDNETKITHGACDYGERTIHYFEGDKCIWENRTNHYATKEKCTNHVFASTAFIFSMILTSLLLIVISVLVICACMKKNSMKKLIQFKESKAQEMN